MKIRIASLVAAVLFAGAAFAADAPGRTGHARGEERQRHVQPQDARRAEVRGLPRRRRGREDRASARTRPTRSASSATRRRRRARRSARSATRRREPRSAPRLAARLRDEGPGDRPLFLFGARYRACVLDSLLAATLGSSTPRRAPRRFRSVVGPRVALRLVAARARTVPVSDASARRRGRVRSAPSFARQPASRFSASSGRSASMSSARGAPPRSPSRRGIRRAAREQPELALRRPSRRACRPARERGVAALVHLQRLQVLQDLPRAGEHLRRAARRASRPRCRSCARRRPARACAGRPPGLRPRGPPR